MNYDYIKLHTICGETISANNLLMTHSSELMSLSETIGGCFIELCDHIAQYELFDDEVTADNLHDVVSESVELIDKDGLTSVRVQRTRDGCQVEFYTQLDNAPHFIKEASETFNVGEIIHHSTNSKDELFHLERSGEYRQGFNDYRSLLWSPAIDRWLEGEP